MEESNVCVCVGERIPVNVETVFKDGFVVSFTGSDGIEYRGALLSPVVGPGRGQCRSQAVPSVRSPNSTRANPLSYLHDHPYSNMKKYAKKLSTTMPPDVLLQWNSVPPATIYPNHIIDNGVASRSRRSLRDQTATSTATHAASIDVHELEPKSGFPTYIPGLVRHAKFVAHMRMKVDLEEQSNAGCTSRSRSCDPPQSKRCRRSTSPLPSNKKHKKRQRSPDSSGKETTPPPSAVTVPSTSPSIPLKDFSIRVSKVTTHCQNNSIIT